MFGSGLLLIVVFSFATTLYVLDRLSPESPPIAVRSATYGGNCHGPTGNATVKVQSACSGKKVCDYHISVRELGDPANGCGKDFSVDYACGATAKTAGAAGESDGKLVHLSCP